MRILGQRNEGGKTIHIVEVVLSELRQIEQSEFPGDIVAKREVWWATFCDDVDRWNATAKLSWRLYGCLRRKAHVLHFYHGPISFADWVQKVVDTFDAEGLEQAVKKHATKIDKLGPRSTTELVLAAKHFPPPKRSAKRQQDFSVAIALEKLFDDDAPEKPQSTEPDLCV